jgi:hypothetical protein
VTAAAAAVWVSQQQQFFVSLFRYKKLGRSCFICWQATTQVRCRVIWCRSWGSESDPGPSICMVDHIQHVRKLAGCDWAQQTTLLPACAFAAAASALVLRPSSCAAPEQQRTHIHITSSHPAAYSKQAGQPTALQHTDGPGCWAGPARVLRLPPGRHGSKTGSPGESCQQAACGLLGTAADRDHSVRCSARGAAGHAAAASHARPPCFGADIAGDGSGGVRCNSSKCSWFSGLQ